LFGVIVGVLFNRVLASWDVLYCLSDSYNIITSNPLLEVIDHCFRLILLYDDYSIKNLKSYPDINMDYAGLLKKFGWLYYLAV